MQKNPQVDLKFQYRRVLEYSIVLSLLLLIASFMVFKKFNSDVNVRAIDAPPLKVEDIPITRTIKKIEIPRKPTIPIADPEVDPVVDMPMPEFEYNPTIAKLPPPPPMDEENYPYWKVEIKPELIGGPQAIVDYINRNRLYPKVAADAGISGDVMIDFILGTDGVPRNVHIIMERPQGLGFGDAGVKVMQAMRFSPGMQRDKPVSVSMQQPIKFVIE